MSNADKALLRHMPIYEAPKLHNREIRKERETETRADGSSNNTMEEKSVFLHLAAKTYSYFKIDQEFYFYS